jgi:hypothetical protein
MRPGGGDGGMIACVSVPEWCATGVSVQDLRDIRVTWQMAVVICALAVIPMAGPALIAGIVAPGPQGRGTLDHVCAVLLVVSVLFGALAIHSHLARVNDLDHRTALAKQIGVGVSMIVVAACLTAVSFFFASFSAFGSVWFLVPSGVYFSAVVLVARAMALEND